MHKQVELYFNEVGIISYTFLIERECNKIKDGILCTTCFHLHLQILYQFYNKTRCVEGEIMHHVFVAMLSNVQLKIFAELQCTSTSWSQNIKIWANAHRDEDKTSYEKLPSCNFE